jgi:hypothetical protein
MSSYYNWPLSETNGDIKVPVSTIFVFDNRDFQAGANTVYVYTSTANGQMNSMTTGRSVQFKTDLERMQYLIGKFAAYKENPNQIS